MRGRVVAKEQEEIFAAINFEEGQAVELDEVERTFARAFHLSLYALLGLLIAGIAAYAVNRGIDAPAARPRSSRCSRPRWKGASMCCAL